MLREFVEDDWGAVLAYQSDPRYLRFYPHPAPTPEQARAFVAQFLDQQVEVPRWKWQLAIELAQTGQLIGNCGLRLDAPGTRTGNIGFELAPNFWGRGYATEAAREMLRFGFADLRLERIWARCIAENEASARVLERIGMRLAEREPAAEHFQGRDWDALIYSLEWRSWQSRSRVRPIRK